MAATFLFICIAQKGLFLIGDPVVYFLDILFYVVSVGCPQAGDIRAARLTQAKQTVAAVQTGSVIPIQTGIVGTSIHNDLHIKIPITGKRIKLVLDVALIFEIKRKINNKTPAPNAT